MAVIPPSDRVMAWLRAGVPLTLLADLADPAGPPSREILRREAVADDVRRELAGPPSAQRADFTAESAAC